MQISDGYVLDQFSIVFSLASDCLVCGIWHQLSTFYILYAIETPLPILVWNVGSVVGVEECDRKPFSLAVKAFRPKSRSRDMDHH